MILTALFLGLVARGLADLDCHPATGACFEEPPATDRPHMWLGNPPHNCVRSPEDCALYGFEYDVSHPHGPMDSEWCFTGTKHRCVSPTPPPLKETPANELKLVIYNIFERDFFISHDGQRERTCRIPRWFAENVPEVDAFLFQEVFMGGCWHNQQATLRAVLAQHGYPYSTLTTDSDRRVQPGGIFIASRWPIVETKMHIFKSFIFKSWDAFAAKGASYAKIEKTVGGVTRRYNLMSTHMQAGGGHEGDQVRIGQAEEWGEFARSLNIPADEAIIYGGDFNTDLNTDTYDVDIMMYHLRSKLPLQIGDLTMTSDGTINDVTGNAASPTHQGGYIDFFLYSEEHRQPGTATMEVLVPAVAEKFPVCWCEECIPLRGYRYPDDFKCPEVLEIAHLSDHQAVLGTFVF